MFNIHDHYLDLMEKGYLSVWVDIYTELKKKQPRMNSALLVLWANDMLKERHKTLDVGPAIPYHQKLFKVTTSSQ